MTIDAHDMISDSKTISQDPAKIRPCYKVEQNIRSVDIAFVYKLLFFKRKLIWSWTWKLKMFRRNLNMLIMVWISYTRRRLYFSFQVGSGSDEKSIGSGCKKITGSSKLELWSDSLKKKLVSNPWRRNHRIQEIRIRCFV